MFVYYKYMEWTRLGTYITLDKVLITIQSMILNDYPLKNEPGLEDSPIDK